MRMDWPPEIGILRPTKGPDLTSRITPTPKIPPLLGEKFRLNGEANVHVPRRMGKVLNFWSSYESNWTAGGHQKTKS